MPQLVRLVPAYRKHRASGQAIVTVGGHDVYLGLHGSKASRLKYDRVIAEWLANGRQAPTPPPAERPEFTVVELAAAYRRHAESYYRKDGEITSEVPAVVSALKVLCRLYGRQAANEFGPLMLQAVQQAMIRAGWTRKNINKQVQRIVRIFGWGASQEMVRSDIPQALREVDGLAKGRTLARETAPVRPVNDGVVAATVTHLPAIVADMVRLQRLTGCRPAEVCMLRPCDVDTSSPVWAYRPSSHKTEHHGYERVIFIGPRGQDVLRPYLVRDNTAFCFCPVEAEQKRRAELHEHRKTPLQQGNRPGSNQRATPQRKAGERYSTCSYRRAILRACELAFGMPQHLRRIGKDLPEGQKKERRQQASEWRREHAWHPNQLRHSTATEIRKQFGLEAAQVTLGHAAADVTQVYAERDLEKAAAIMAQVGYGSRTSGLPGRGIERPNGTRGLPRDVKCSGKSISAVIGPSWRSCSGEG